MFSVKSLQSCRSSTQKTLQTRWQQLSCSVVRYVLSWCLSTPKQLFVWPCSLCEWCLFWCIIHAPYDAKSGSVLLQQRSSMNVLCDECNLVLSEYLRVCVFSHLRGVSTLSVVVYYYEGNRATFLRMRDITTFGIPLNQQSFVPPTHQWHSHHKHSHPMCVPPCWPICVWGSQNSTHQIDTTTSKSAPWFFVFFFNKKIDALISRFPDLKSTFFLTPNFCIGSRKLQNMGIEFFI